MSPLTEPTRIVLKNYNTPAAIAGVAPTLDYRFALDRRELDAVSLTDKLTVTRAATATVNGPTGYLELAGPNVARFDHNLTTYQSLGLLMEETRTNYVTNSVGTNMIAPPDRFLGLGLGFGQFIVPSAQTNYNLWSINGLYGAIWNVTFYLWNKPENDVLEFKLAVSSFYFVTSATTTVDGITLSCSGEGFTTVSITPLGNNLYKCNATARVATAGAVSNSQLRAIGTFTGGERILVSHIQAEIGQFSTSYIPTTGSIVTRTESATIDGTGVITGTYTMVEKPTGCAVVNGTNIDLQTGYTAERVMVFPAALSSEQITAIRSVM